MKTILPATLLAAALLVGCQTKHGYVKPTQPPEVTEPGRAHLFDFKLAAADVVRMMQSDEDFRTSYNAVKAGKGERPVLMVGNIELGSKSIHPNDRLIPHLNNFRSQLRTALRKAGLFTIIDDAGAGESNSETVVGSLVQNANSGLWNDAGLQSLGQDFKADYYLLGVYREFEAEGRYSYVLELTLKNLRTWEDDWNDIVYVEKQ